MNEITWDSILIFLIFIGALAYALRRLTLPTTRCGNSPSCVGCAGNTYTTRNGNKAKKNNKCYMLDENYKRSQK